LNHTEKVVAFDIEIINDVKPPYSWSRPEELGIGVACTYSPEDGYRDWFGGGASPVFDSFEITEMVGYLGRFDRILTWNGVGFDLKVIDGYMPEHIKNTGTTTSQVLAGKHTDLMLDAQASCGHRVGLGSVTKALFDDEKQMDGAKAPGMWRNGQRLEVIKYCRDDVLKTYKVWEFGRDNGYIESAYKGQVKQIPVEWTLR